MTTVHPARVTSRARPSFDVHRIRADFPILRHEQDGARLVYLDNAATSQKPALAIEAVRRFYAEQNANIHRGVYRLSERATAAYEEAREKIRQFINAASHQEVVFVRGTTEAINLVAQSFARPRVGPGDEIVVSVMEHHSNIVPWQLVCESTGARLRVVPMTDEGELLLDEYENLLTERTKMVALVHVSNSLGTVNPARDLVQIARDRNIPVLLDGAQAVPHLQVDVQNLNCDFYTFSGHKMFGPTGIGVLYGKAAHLDTMPPYQGGGDMILSVRFEKTVYAAPPAKFEAGTPHVAGAIGLAAAIDYIDTIDHAALMDHEGQLLATATDALSSVPGVRLIGTAGRKVSVVSFVMNGIHAHDVGTILDQQGVCIRTGHHCTQPVMDRMGVPATARASFAFYNTHEEIDALIEALGQVREVFGV
jgi:cysteine desulfurase/selenocysteine lyase